MKYLFVLFFIVSCASEPDPKFSVIDADDEVRYKKIIKKNSNDLRECFEEYSTEKRPVELSLSLIIDGEGELTKVDVISNHNMNKDLKECLIDEIHGMKFFRPQGGGTFNIEQRLHFNIRNK